MDQAIVNWLLAGLSGVLGFLLRAIWQAVRDLQESDKEITEKITAIEVLVAGNYIKREEFDKAIDRLFEKLDVIDRKLDNKADK
jgi:Flp pilus assembly protein CpaB